MELGWKNQLAFAEASWAKERKALINKERGELLRKAMDCAHLDRLRLCGFLEWKSKRWPPVRYRGLFLDTRPPGKHKYGCNSFAG